MNSLIYLNKCLSTNDEIIDFLNSSHSEEDLLAIFTFNQTKGKGQYGNSWENSPHQNIAYSLAFKSKNFTISDNLFNFYTAILLRDFLANLTKNEVKIKWPNDIIIKNKKISGMLIEKKQNFIILGIGINILQENFEKLPKAGSLLTQTQLKYDLKDFTESLHQYFCSEILKNRSAEEILNTFNENLYKKDEISVFEIKNSRQNGIIKNIDENGFLWVELERDGLQKFFHKEIELLY